MNGKWGKVSSYSNVNAQFKVFVILLYGVLTQLVLCFTLLLSYSKCLAETVVRVEATDGGPQIVVNGKRVPPRMFWGIRHSGKVATGYRWQEASFEFSSPFDANATLHFRFGQQAGEVWLADVRIVRVATGEDILPRFSFATPEGFASTWNIWPPDERNTVGRVEVVDSSVHVSLTDPPSGTPWPDFHLYSRVVGLKANMKYRCSFRVRAVPNRLIIPCVYHVDVENHLWVPIGRPPDPFLQEVAIARDAGVNFISFYAPNCWSPPERQPDWRLLDIICQEIINVNPDALLIPRVSMDAPQWWIERHPDALMVYEDGKVGPKVSVSHRQYRTDAAAHIERLCQHLCEQFPNNFAGIHIAGQNTDEWFYEGTWGKTLSGYDSATLQAWQASPHGRSQVPDASSRRTASQSLLLDPISNRQVIDFNYFLQDEMADFISALATAARQGTNGKKLILFFYGYHYEFGPVWNGPATSGHYALSRLLKSPDIDILCAPISYFDRDLQGSGPLMSSVESVTLSGKLWLNEDDTRTYLDQNREDHARYGGLANLEQTKSVMLRNTAQAVLRGLGSWWMDHGAGTDGGWFADPKIWEVMTKLRPVDDVMLTRKQPFSPDIAVIMDEGSMMYLAGGSNVIGHELIYKSRAALGRCGAPYGQYMIEDAIQGKVTAMLQIFLNAWALTPVQRQQLVTHLPPGVTRVWCYAPGFILPDRSDVAAMREVSGFTHRIVELDSAVAIPTSTGIEMGLKTSFGPQQRVWPLFSVDAAPEEVLATYPDGSPAVAMRRSQQGIDIFIGPPQLTSELVRALANIAGVHLFTTEDASICAAEGYLSLHAVNDGLLMLNIGSENTVLDALEHTTIGQGPVLNLDVHAGDTRLLYYGQPTSVNEKPTNGTASYELYQNYPNPFNPTTTIRFSLPQREHVTLKVFDTLGREVATLVDGELNAGEYSLFYEAKSLSSGLYICRLQVGQYVQRIKMELVK